MSLTAEGGQITTPDRTVTLDFPAKAIDAAIELDVKVLIPENPYQENGEFRWLTLDVMPRDAARAVDGHLRFAQPATLTVDLAGFPAWLEPYLVHQVDAERDVWEWLPSWYDPETRLLTAQVDTFSQVGVSGATKFPDSATHYLLQNLPDVSTFNGAVAYSYDLQLPPGRAGLTPDLSLGYSSAALNGLMGTVQSNYVGSGWSLGGLIAITRPIKSRRAPVGGSDPMNNWEFSNAFTLMLGGASYHLSGPEPQEPDGGCRYYAEDAPQVLVMRYTAPGGTHQYCGYGPFANDPVPANASQEYWVVTTAEGTQYRLGYTADAEQITRMDCYNPAGGYTLTSSYTGVCSGNWVVFPGYAGEASTRVPYRWSVDRIKDVYGNAAFYNYTEEHRTISDNGYQWDGAQYPNWISYTANISQSTPGSYLVYFVLENRLREGGVWHDDGLRGETLLIDQRPWAMWDEKRIDRIRVCANPSGNSCPDSNASLVEYDLGYQFVVEPWPGLEWILNTISHETTRLTSITRYGWNAQGQKVVLPATTFTYASYNQANDTVDPAWGGDVGGKLQYPRLVAVNNGYGGQVAFTYESVSYGGVYSYRVTRKDTGDGLRIMD